jgi:curli production assembly/transport component CsgG|tara:strand:- start:1635 stop:2546 length:912 start_codon:yes stop_codon:yes gene_type:complete
MAMVVRYLLITLLALSGCAQIPQWSNDPQNCIDDDPNLWSNFKSRKYICVDAAVGVRLPAFIDLLNLPPAKDMPVVAVYGFKDLTGQRKSVDGLASFSTAVTQGSTEMLIDALKTAGGGTWFRVVERQGIDNLVRERQIVRSTRQDIAKASGEEPKGVGPLLFAGMIIEGGIIGYDSNTETGGRGARYLGIGFSRMYRKDVVTVSIRAVSVLTGEVLLNVQAKKSVLSYGSSGDLFRFYEQGTQLIEYEDGVGNNESVTYAVRTAIEAGVLELIYQGHDRKFWHLNESQKGALKGEKENEELN